MTTSSKVQTLPELEVIVRDLKAQGKRIVTTNGCFDIIHRGHVESLEWARSQGDVLVLGINSDRSVRENKGPKRPIFGEQDRMRVLAGFEAVTYVFVFDEKSPVPWIERLRPDVHVKGEGSEKSSAFAGEKQAIEAVGGEVRLAPKTHESSTTGTIETVLERYSND